mmetsp:Transcript_9896/g.27713  ORF Transcript_9896/g.27713 Transcript_9896/m.27713 type:complete len:164 (+) Transcript_9896:65-556(+)|eukprot:CAMPEP_0181042804 /NCGR_PEP_ID=MMETSP1070-20121207/12353_1 /TAXON_ID=265543 /ORGANISM="Minutocellus polymorphus, Strain NH13" /LENGTH=163 /DNA_ID=CAMNT_0023121057 /DNA_START=23 /DNA_END=514 /DNA_ORIENTATION=-
MSRYFAFLPSRTSSHVDEGKATSATTTYMNADRAGNNEHGVKPTKRRASSPGAAATEPPSLVRAVESAETAESPEITKSPERFMLSSPDQPTPMETSSKKVDNLEPTEKSDAISDDAISDISNNTRTKPLDTGKLKFLKEIMRRKRHPDALGASKIHYGYKIW